jgi:hypothetical protein
LAVCSKAAGKSKRERLSGGIENPDFIVCEGFNILALVAAKRILNHESNSLPEQPYPAIHLAMPYRFAAEKTWHINAIPF